MCFGMDGMDVFRLAAEARTGFIDCGDLPITNSHVEERLCYDSIR